MRRCASAVAAKKKSVVVNTFQSFNQTRVVFFPSFLPTDKHETKLKGVIYFQAIEEVYYDHLRSATKVRRNTHFLSSLSHILYFHLTFSFISNMSVHTLLCFFSPCFCFGRLLSQKGFFNLNMMTSVCIHTLCSPVSPHWALCVQTIDRIVS